MDTMMAFQMGRMNRHKELMVFDWEKAAQIIRERKPDAAAAGLAGDWEYTGGYILSNGKPIPEDDTYVYLASTWATPQLEINGEIIECYRMQSETPNGEWDEKTFWPEEALKILEG